ncbi:Hypothetical protein SRAE_2000263700 [Strongyloides ratti]|uniref:Uncharacterized protein n=1 Tax=Strongyloides ratti TaxID=34506 RepID=A0A090LDV3_STRRB|nr:Hypothetical protein SRAE_2000263700 [Strongyloides ratti]CEF67976.1 Hypothetical protein SRAE_2000263700 [Strongyloides ratti]
MNGSYNGQSNIIIQQSNYINDSFCSGTDDEIPPISSNNSIQITSNGSGNDISFNINHVIQSGNHMNGNSILHQTHHNQNIYESSNSFHQSYHHISEYQDDTTIPSTSSSIGLQYTSVDSNPTSNGNIITLNSITNSQILHNSSSHQIILTSPKEESSTIVQKYETSGEIIPVNRNNNINGSLSIATSTYLEHHPNSILLSSNDIDNSNHHQVSDSNYVTTTSQSHISTGPTYYLETVKNSPIVSGPVNGNHVVYRTLTSICNNNQNMKHNSISSGRDNICFSLKNSNNNSIQHEGGQQSNLICNNCNIGNNFNSNTNLRPFNNNNNYEKIQQNINQDCERILKKNIHKITLKNNKNLERIEYVSFSPSDLNIIVSNNDGISQKISKSESIEKEMSGYIDDSQNVEKIIPTEDNNIGMIKNSNKKEKFSQSKVTTLDEDHKKQNMAKQQKLEAKRARQAEVARKRYHNLSEEEKKELNKKRTFAQKMKRQRDKEMMELDNILRQSNDIIEDPEINKILKSKKMRARWAEAARARYHRMTPEEKKTYNLKRRMKQLSSTVHENEEMTPEEKQKILQKNLKEQNAKKAEAARLRYHAMTDEEKRAYNKKRTEALRKKRDEEEKLLSIPVKNITKDTWEKAQKILTRNEKRAAAARLRYQKMTPEERRLYNRRKPKNHSSKNSEFGHSESLNDEQLSYDERSDKTFSMSSSIDCSLEENDVLLNIEKDVIRRTHIAKQTLIRQNNYNIQKKIEKRISNSNSNINNHSNYTSQIHQSCEDQLILNDLHPHSMSESDIVYSQDGFVQILPESLSIESNVLENYQSSPMSSQTYHHDESNLIDL